MYRIHELSVVFDFEQCFSVNYRIIYFQQRKIDMDWKIIKRKWNIFQITNLLSRGILRKKYFDNIDHIKDPQAAKIQNIYGIKNEQIEAEIEFYDSF